MAKLATLVEKKWHMESFILPQLYELQALRGKPVVIYSSTIDSDVVRILYECLRQMGPTQRLDVVLSTPGGVVTIARRLALLLREFTQHLTILVPYHAKSAGTLLCLSANELVLGPMAELGPIDAHIGSVGASPSDAPSMISTEDVRAFRQMAEDWFGVNREEDHLQVLALMAERVFPTSLGSFYRSDRLTRQAAQELLYYQLPDVEENTRQRIVNQLVGGYYAHDHIITRVEARNLGLQVRFASPQEEALLWDISKTNRRQFLEHTGRSDDEGIIGLIMSAHFCARQVLHWADVPRVQRVGMRQGKEGGSQTQKISHVSWEIDGE